MEMADSPRLPPELIARIVIFAASHGISVLRSLTLTCKSIHPQAEFLLYKNMDITEWLPSHHNEHYWPRLNGVLKTLGSNKRIASHVKSFFIELPTFYYLYDEPIFLPLLTKAFIMMFNLKKLSIEGYDYPFKALGSALYVAGFQLEELNIPRPLGGIYHRDENAESVDQIHHEFLEIFELFLSQQNSLLSISVGMWPETVEWEDNSQYIEPMPASVVPNLMHIAGPPSLANVFLPMRPSVKHLSLSGESDHPRGLS
jgi:hypothetical protein